MGVLTIAAVTMYIHASRIGNLISINGLLASGTAEATSAATLRLSLAAPFTAPVEFRPITQDLRMPAAVKNGAEVMGHFVLSTAGEFTIYAGPTVADLFTIGNAFSVRLQAVFVLDA
jgi:hypothetical protein